jgi:hypothetical protein
LTEKVESWLGGMRWSRSGVGVAGASWPFCRLTIGETELYLGPASRLLARLTSALTFGPMPRFRVPFAELERCEHCRASALLFGYPGIRFWFRDVKYPVIFWLWWWQSPEPMLRALEGKGSDVDRTTHVIPILGV